MNDKFFDLKKEKQDRMINAALKVFAENGYKRASTDEIVSVAGISKGLLFHYFNSKLGLYSFVFEYSVRFITLELSSFVSKEESNYFQLMKQKEKAVCQVLKNYPYMQLFLDRSQTENVFEALQATGEQKNILKDQYSEMLNQVDFSGFHPAAEPAMVCRITDDMMHSIMKRSFDQNAFQPEMLYEDACQYLDMMEQLILNR